MAKASVNLFETAAPVEKKSSSKNKEEMVAMKGIKHIARLKVMVDSLTAIYEVACTELKKTSLTSYFQEKGTEIGRPPENIRATEDEASASCQLRVRGANSPLKDFEILMCKTHGLEINEAYGRRFLVNEKYQDNMELLQKVSKKLQEIKDFPADFFEINPGVAIVTERAVEQVFEKERHNSLPELLPIVTTLAVKPNLGTEDTTEAWVEAVNELKPGGAKFELKAVK